jgi:hypothetical protein
MAIFMETFVLIRVPCSTRAGGEGAKKTRSPVPTPLRKLGQALGEFATYITNNANYVVNYGERFRAGERISTGFVESAVDQVVDKRFDKRQSMRWTPTGAHMMLQARTRVLNGDLDQLIRGRYPNFRKPAAKEFAPGL